MSYFKPLRKKLGIVTLLVACAFASGLLRSYSYFDYVQVTFREPPIHTLASDNGRVVWIRNYSSIVANKDLPLFFARHSIELKNRRLSEFHVILFFGVEPKWIEEFRWRGFTFLNGTGRGFQGSVVAVPYWSIVISLTALSAWLLLSKTQKTVATGPNRISDG